MLFEYFNDRVNEGDPAIASYVYGLTRKSTSLHDDTRVQLSPTWCSMARKVANLWALDSTDADSLVDLIEGIAPPVNPTLPHKSTQPFNHTALIVQQQNNSKLHTLYTCM